MQTYLFYDIETTGLNKAFDQVLQFAAIRTNLQLQELDRIEIKIKLNSDVIPHPAALLTHEISIHHMLQGENELEAIKKIHTLLNTPGTISLGYNTLGFDDEFLRFSFYRNLLPPYHHQFKNQCYRMDIYPITLFFYLYKNSILKWPDTLKLADLKTLNQLGEGRSHNAMVDVEATVALTKIFMEEREMWQYMQGFFNKEIERARLQPNLSTINIMIDGRMREQQYQTPVLYLGNHQHYKNQIVFLRLDSVELTSSTVSRFVDTTRAINKKYGEPNFILPLSKNKLSPEIITLAEKNKNWLNQNPDVFAAIVNYYTHFQYPLYPETDIDASLYLNGFWSTEEETLCRLFHEKNIDEKIKIFETFENPRLKKLALRVLGRHYFDQLKHVDKELFTNYLGLVHHPREALTLIDFQGKKRLTRVCALQEINELRKSELSTKALELLADFERYLLN